jgi:hypothetical protein
LLLLFLIFHNKLIFFKVLKNPEVFKQAGKANIDVADKSTTPAVGRRYDSDV